MKMNLSNIKEYEFSLLPVGTYLAKVVSNKQVLSTNNNIMWNLGFTILEEEYENRRVFGRIVFGKVDDEGDFQWNEGSYPFAKNMLCGFAPVLGFDLTDKNGFDVNLHLDDDDNSGFDVDSLVDIEIMAQVSQETNTTNGKLINVVKATIPVEQMESEATPF